MVVTLVAVGNGGDVFTLPSVLSISCFSVIVGIRMRPTALV